MTLWRAAAAVAITVLGVVALNVLPRAGADHDINAEFGLMFIGDDRVESYTFTNTGSDSTRGPSFTTGPFEVVADGCSGRTLSDGESCDVTVRPEATLEPGTHLGTVQFRDVDLTDFDGLPLRVELVRAMLAVVGWHAGDGQPVVFGAHNSQIGFSGGPHWVNVAASRGDEWFRVGLREGSGQPLQPGRYDTLNSIGRDGPRVWLIGDGPRCDDGYFIISEIEVDGEALVHLRAEFFLDCGASGVVAFDAAPYEASLWMPSSITDFETVGVSTAHRGAFVVNTSPQPLPALAQTAGLTGVVMASNDCAVERTLPPWAACSVGLTTMGTRQGQSFGGEVRFRSAGIESAIPIVGHQSISRIAWYRAYGDSVNRTASFYAASTLGQLRLVESAPGGLVTFVTRPGTSSNINLFAARAGPGVYDFAGGGPLFDRLHRGCTPLSAKVHVDAIEWSEQSEVTKLLATIVVECADSGLSRGLVTINADAATAVIQPSWVRQNFGNYAPQADERTLRLTNVGDRVGTVEASIAVNPESSFMLSGEGCRQIVLQPGQSCDQQVVFSPLSRSGEPLWAVIEVGGIHAFSGMEVIPWGYAPRHWPITRPAERHPVSGYWLLHKNGNITPFGDANNAGNGRWVSGTALKIEPTPAGRGYWILSTEGQIWSGGDADHFGHLDDNQRTAMEPGERPVSISATPTGAGYWIFTSRGRVFPLSATLPISVI